MTRIEYQPAKLGGFVVGGIVLAMLAFILWGPLANLWERKYVIFFDETATGLDPGSAVRLNGVTIGKVDSIDLFWDQTQTNRVYTAVVVFMDPAKIKSISKGGQSFDSMLAKKEISARLGISGIVSLALEVELKIEPEPLKPSDYRAWHMKDYSAYFGRREWIPARQSTIAKVLAKLDDVLGGESIPNIITSISVLLDTNNPNGLIFKTSRTMDNLHGLISTVNKTIASNTNDLRAAMSNLSQLAASVRPKLDLLLSNLNNASISARDNLDKFGAGVGAITNSLPDVLADLDGVSAQLNVVLRGAAPVPPQALAALRSLQDTLESLQRLLDYVESHPDALLRGRATEK
ncbi:MAG TPA: MlaD family protein [Verrucomicrobiae bacterium]|jgi:paraquat-inducible protein B